MDYLEWNDFFVTGIDRVDAEHRGLVERVNRAAPLLAAAGDAVPAEAQPLIDDLRRYAATHFATEAELMRRQAVDARHVEHHLAAHRDFSERVRRLSADYLAGRRVSGHELLTFVTHWLIFHILGEDQSMARQLRGLAAGASPAAAFDEAGGIHTNPAQEALTHALVGMYALATAQKRELQAYKDDLERIVRERTQALASAHERLRKVDFALDRVGIGILWVDLGGGRCSDANEQAAAMLGYRRDEMAGLALAELEPDLDAPLRAELAQALRERGSLLREVLLRHRDGRLIPVELRVHALDAAPGEPAQAIGFVADISERKAVEARYVQARAAAEQASRAKGEFLANMSHEIRTPLNAILGLAHLVRRDGAAPHQMARLDKIIASALHLLSVINDILDISKIESGKMVLERSDFAVGEVMDYVASAVEEAARAKGLRVQVDAAGVPAFLRGDLTRLRQALLNLAGNAVKFTEHGVIDLRARVDEVRDDGCLVRFEVADTGIGIPADKMALLFRLFQQTDASTTRRYGGSGLGLNITRRLAGRDDGRRGRRLQHRGRGQRLLVQRLARARHGAAAAPAAGSGAGGRAAAPPLRQAHPAGRGRSDQPRGRVRAAALGRARGRPRARRQRGRRARRRRRLRADPDGHADAAPGRARGDARDPRAGAAPRDADRRDVGQRLRGRAPAVPGRGDERHPGQAGRAGPPVRGRAGLARWRRRRARGRRGGGAGG
ncbi:MAG: PAS domain S-box protein, partial [Burkholderiales bacterium]|nr:PAS domain S-box protein [Burkholderiales bacterium]